MGKAKRLKAEREAAKQAPEQVPFPRDDPTDRDHELRLNRALAHLEQLGDEIGRYIDAALKTVVEEPNPDAPGENSVWVTAFPPPRDPFSLLIGEVLQGIRSALDYLTLELAASFTSPLPDDIEKDSEFPIFGDKRSDGAARFHQVRSKGALAGAPAPGSGLAKTRGMDPVARAVIEALQPYQRGHMYETDWLWRIHELNRIDKHRLLHASVASFEGAIWDFRNSRNLKGLAPGVLKVFSGNVNGRTEVARYPPMPIDPNKEVYSGFQPFLRVVFADGTPLVAGEPVLPVLSQLYNYVVTCVLPPLRGFLK